MTAPFSQLLAPGPRRGILSAAVAAARDFLIDPVDPAEGPLAAASDRRPTVAVFGLARGCGTTVVARALAAELARRDSAGAAAVACEPRRAALVPATPAAKRLARALAHMPGHVRALGRLCLVEGVDPARLAEAVRGVAPCVVDVGAALPGGVQASLADHMLIVTAPAVEPALACVAAECVARVGRESTLVLNQVRGEGDSGPASLAGGAVRVPPSRVGAQLALSGREVHGHLGRAIAELADRCEEGS